MRQQTDFAARPLLQRSPLFLGESLPSLLARLSILNLYTSSSVLAEVIQLRWPDRPDCPMSSTTFERLEQLTGIPTLDLLSASDHEITPPHPKVRPLEKHYLSPIHEAMAWLPEPLERDLHPTKASWYCPKCLEEAAYHRLAWRPASMAACLQHDCLLLNICPNCQQPISISDIVLVRCHKCQADLRQADTVALNGNKWGRISQIALFGWRTNTLLPDLEYGWPTQHPALLCSLAEGLAVGILFLAEYLPPHVLKPNKPLKLHRLSDLRPRTRPSDIYWAYSCAVEFMANWPEGFRAFLHLAAPGPENILGPNLGPFYTYWIMKQWEHPDFGFILNAWEDFRRDRSWFARNSTSLHTPFAQVPYFARLEEAAKILAIPENAVIRLGQMNLVTQICSTTAILPARYFLRSDLRKLKQSWEQSLSLQETSHWLGLPDETVLRLTKESVLKTVTTPNCEVRFAKKEIANFLSEVDNCALGTDRDNGLVSLADAAEQLLSIRLDRARLLKLTLSRQLQAWRSPLQQLFGDSGEISFTRKDLDLLMRKRAKQKGWISAENAASSLKVGDRVLLGWVERGFLKTVASYNGRLYLEQKVFQEFLAEHIFFDQARDLLGLTAQRMMEYIRRGNLVPISGPDLDGCDAYLFTRGSVEELVELLQRHSSPV